jgi:hypothetical protein
MNPPHPNAQRVFSLATIGGEGMRVGTSLRVGRLHSALRIPHSAFA